MVSAAVQLQPQNAKYRNSLGVVLEKQGKMKEAVDAFERANEKDPLNVQILLNLSRSLKSVKRPARAAEVLASVIKLQPDHPAAHQKRASLLRSLGRKEEALAELRQHLRLHPSDSETLFWISALTGTAADMPAMPQHMVAGLFDQYAEKFDNHLVNQLSYQTPQLIMSMLSLHVPAEGWQRAADLGCGTGLMGPLVRAHVTGQLEGVDLSAGMVEQARQRGCYDALQVAELVEHLQASTSGSKCPYDLLVAADVFVYIGDLAPVLNAAATSSRPGCVFAFSVEQAEACSSSKGGQQECAPYTLTLTGRYAHSAGYVKQVAESTGWEVVGLSVDMLRMNAGVPVMGHLCMLKRRDS